MRHQRAGHVFGISSVAGYAEGRAMHSASEFAVTGFTKSLAAELGPCEIKVTDVAPDVAAVGRDVKGISVGGEGRFAATAVFCTRIRYDRLPVRSG